MSFRLLCSLNCRLGSLGHLRFRNSVASPATKLSVNMYVWMVYAIKDTDHHLETGRPYKQFNWIVWRNGLSFSSWKNASLHAITAANRKLFVFTILANIKTKQCYSGKRRSLIQEAFHSIIAVRAIRYFRTTPKCAVSAGMLHWLSVSARPTTVVTCADDPKVNLCQQFIMEFKIISDPSGRAMLGPRFMLPLAEKAQ